MKRARWLPILACVLGGCIAKHPYARDPLPVPERWKAEAPADSAPVAAPDLWWSSFGDLELPALLAKARAGSFDLRAAAARTKAAADGVIVARAASVPTLAIVGAPVDPGATSDRSRSRRDSGRYEVGLDARYELDLWRRVSSTIEAAEREHEASVFELEAVRTAVEMAVAHGYFEVRRLDGSVELETRRTELARERARLTDMRKGAGRVGADAVSIAQEALRDAGARLAGVRRERALAEQRLAILLGEAPESVAVPPASLRTKVHAPVPPTGLPSSVLARRPDVRAAEARLAALHAKIAVARAALFPEIVLTARLGFASDVLRDKTPMLLYGFGPEVQYSVFDSGARRAEVDASEARREEALAGYQKAVYGALGDVERALLDYQAAVEAVARTAAASDEHAGRVLRARAALAAGRSSRLDLLDAEDTALVAEAASLAAYAATLDALVGLYQALGGGWEPPAA